MGLKMPKIYNTYSLPSSQELVGCSSFRHLVSGSVVDALFAGPLSDRVGRRDAIFRACLFRLTVTAIQVACNGYGMLIGGRPINGVCVGITSSQVPVYLAEIVKKEIRGSIIVIQQLAIEWGIFIMFFVGYGCSFIAGPASFHRHSLPPPLTSLASQTHGGINDPLVVAEWEEITTVLQAEREALQGWRKFIKNGMWRRTFSGTSVQAWQQLSGANVMT
ncbi:hypothetical protein ABVK25_010182 [Lepraria finkii]|uniref:Major facilitator superfamily (MFS) profile domain-containing protein n=1 Tax=Lepraria finkii TaxID=1340010 RepID=A0ABR4AVA0_9LECA